MVGVTELGYPGLNVSDGLAWRQYVAECVGLEVLDEGEGEGDRFYCAWTAGIAASSCLSSTSA